MAEPTHRTGGSEPARRSIAYFSMEIALEVDMPTYAGGLGVVAGDTVRAAADLDVPMLAVTLLHRAGYFRQRLDAEGRQTEEPERWVVDEFLEEVPTRATVTVEGRAVGVRAWRYLVRGAGGSSVPVYFLDTDVPDNSDYDRQLTHRLYGGDERYRLCQEVVLGIGGVRMVRALGYLDIERFHMNEGHSSLLALELLEELARRNGRRLIGRADIEEVRDRCIFTTHTPVHAGHDQFPLELVRRVLGPYERLLDMEDVFTVDVLRRILPQRSDVAERVGEPPPGTKLNMTYVGLNLSGYVNGVAKRHGEVSRLMFGDYPVDSITNGVHVASWACPPVRALFDRHVPDWRHDSFSLRYALGIPREEIWSAHAEARRQLIRQVDERAGVAMDEDHLILGFGRRATAYKRADLLFSDLARLRRIAAETGPLQLIFAGKAHPDDEAGKALIRTIHEAIEKLRPDVAAIYLENYDLRLARLMVAGSDVWLNTPDPPNEASGTSGMKAAINGVPSLSVLDGWWLEGHIEGVTGWAIGSDREQGHGGQRPGEEAGDLYDKLERDVVPLFYRDRAGFIDVMRHAIALNGSFFHAHRMLQQYVLRAYFP